MKHSLTTLLLLILSLNTQAQLISNWGFKFGIGSSNVSRDFEDDIAYDSDFKSGFTARLYCDFLDVPFFKIQGEVGYIRKGFTDDIPVTTVQNPYGTGETTDAKLDYLNFTILAKYKLNISLVNPYILAGPQTNVLVGNYLNSKPGVFDYLNDVNLGYSIGAGVELLEILPVTIVLEYRYERDFLDNYDASFVDIKNYSHVVMAGIQF